MDIAHFKDRLLQQKADLVALRQLSADSRQAVELDQSKVGRLSRMDALQQQEMAKASETQRAFAIQRIDAALSRIDEDEYGYCVDCGEEIAAKRLDVDPATPLCIDCAG